MAIVTIQTIENLLTREQKSRLIAQITDVILEVKGEEFRRLTWVRIEEVPEGNLGVGGTMVYARDFDSFRNAAGE
jgi:4-oxalocrotonate tautomerase